MVTWVKKLTKWVLYLYSAAKSRQSCLTLRNPIDSSPPSSSPQDSPGKNTGVGCHFLLQCMKVKSENEVTQLCLTLCDPMYCSLQGPSIHGISQARVPERVAIAFSGIYMTHGLKGFFKLLPQRKHESVSHSVVSSSLRPHGLQPSRHLCQWNSLGKNTGVCSHSIIQGFFWTQRSNWCLLH